MFPATVGVVSACTVGFADRRPPPRPDTLPEPPELEAAATVWPKAMLTLPAELKKGLSVQPVAMLGKNEVLMVAPFAARPQFVTYSLRTGRHRLLATAPKWADCGACYMVRNVAVGETQIAWTAEVYRSEPWNAGKRHLELWAMPRSGGQMRLVTWLTGHGEVPFDDELSIEGDQVVWRSGADGYRVPLAGGKVQAISSGGEGRPEIRPDPDVWDLSCGVRWCVGEVRPRRYELTRVVLRRRDGSGRTTVAASSGGPLIGDRFGLFGMPYVYGGGSIAVTTGGMGTSMVLYDRCTGKSGWVGRKGKVSPSDKVAQGASDPDGPILFWRTRDERRYTVLDLSRISAGPCGS